MNDSEVRNTKRVGILQSNYIPWKGYFDLMDRCDEFVILDDVQFTRRDWRNRNRVKTPQGLKWLTIPVDSRGKYSQLIRETRISDGDWPKAHWRLIQQCYGQAPFFKHLRDQIGDCYRCAEDLTLLSDVNILFIKMIRELLGIKAVVSCSTQYESCRQKSDRILDICVQAGGTEYLSGPAAKDYLVVKDFEDAGIEVQWMDYGAYPEYPQRFEGFEHAVSILDLLFNTGTDASEYWRSGT